MCYAKDKHILSSFFLLVKSFIYKVWRLLKNIKIPIIILYKTKFEDYKNTNNKSYKNTNNKSFIKQNLKTIKIPIINPL